jgi:hypothetical protein
MPKHGLHLLFVWLAALSFVVRSFGAGLPAGYALCIGCDRAALSISEPCDPTATSTCCDADEHDRSDDCDGHDSADDDGTRGCGCVDVPLGDGSAVKASHPRLDLPQADLAKVLATSAAAVCEISPSEAAPNPSLWPRPGPPQTSRLLLPQARRTVLVI